MDKREARAIHDLATAARRVVEVLTRDDRDVLAEDLAEVVRLATVAHGAIRKAEGVTP